MHFFQIAAAVAEHVCWTTLCTMRLVSRTCGAAVQQCMRKRAVVHWLPACGGCRWRFPPRALCFGVKELQLQTDELAEDIRRLQVEAITFRGYTAFEDRRIFAVLPATLRDLALHYCLLPAAVGPLLPPALRSLKLHACEVNHERLSLVDLPSTLRSLTLQLTDVTFPPGTSGLPPLEFLDIEGGFVIEGPPTPLLASSSHLTIYFAGSLSDSDVEERAVRLPASLTRVSVFNSEPGGSLLHPPFLFVVPAASRSLAVGGNCLPLFTGDHAAHLQTLDLDYLSNSSIENEDTGVIAEMWAALARLRAPRLRDVVYPTSSCAVSRDTPMPPLITAAPITHMTLPRHFQGGLDTLPSTAEVVELRHSYDRPLLSKPDGVLPPRLRALSLGPAFNSPLFGLPASLRTLILGDAFRRSLAPLPAGLRTLVLGQAFDDSLEGLACARTLTVLVLTNPRWVEPAPGPGPLYLPALRCFLAPATVCESIRLPQTITPAQAIAVETLLKTHRLQYCSCRFYDDLTERLL